MRLHVQSGHWEYACALFGLTPRSPYTLSEGIEAYARGNSWTAALTLMCRLDVHHWNENHTAAVLLSLRAVARRHTAHWHQALQLYSAASAAGLVSSSVHSLNNLLSVLGLSRKWRQAVSLLEHSTATKLIDRGNAFTIAQTCFALHHSGWSHALLFSSRIISRNAATLPDVVDAVALEKLSLLCLASRRWQEATVVLRLSVSTPRCSLGEATYADLAAVFHASWNSEATRKCLEKVQRKELLHTALNSVIVKSKSRPEAKRYAEQLLTSGGRLDTAGIAVLAELHARDEQWAGALYWFQQWASCPKRRSERRIRAYDHDFLQLSLQGSSCPKNSQWRIAVDLFGLICGDLGVDVSPIARSSAQALCYQSEKPDVAQKLLRFSLMSPDRRRRFRDAGSSEETHNTA
jgi:hypothetical protein